jgi:putative oxidoreductase
MRTMKLLTETNAKLFNICILLLRSTVGVILFGTGMGKVLGSFGGSGLESAIQQYATIGIPAPLAYLSTFTELIGGFLLIVGLLTRPAAFAVMINMLVATIVVLPMGFFTAAANPLSLTVSAAIIVLAGPMAYSIDSLLVHSGEVIPELRGRSELQGLKEKR